MYIILVYDISSNGNGPKRWKKVFGICKRYLTHIQKSVFEGEITKAQLMKMEMEIKEEINDKIDSVIIFKTRNEKWLEKEIWGVDDDPLSTFL